MSPTAANFGRGKSLGAALLLGALGIAGMWQAVFADVGVTVIAVLNSLRVLYGTSKRA